MTARKLLLTILLCAIPAFIPTAAQASFANPWTQTDAANTIWSAVNTGPCAVAGGGWSCFNITGTPYTTPPQPGWPGYGTYQYVDYVTWCQANASVSPYRRAAAAWYGVKNGSNPAFQLSAPVYVNWQNPGVC